MICFKGDEIKLKTGESGEVQDTWGIARTWYKVKTPDGRVIFTMADNIDSIVKRHIDKKGKRWRAQ
ncbi:hypothetical protein ABDI30_16200 [Paenibacillus cisolokensis]|uniref:hypothetical protein n=1 Tax=Paenibacillus cisolokensis TaxID=1658519 RepID=UPI003D27441B